MARKYGFELLWSRPSLPPSAQHIGEQRAAAMALRAPKNVFLVCKIKGVTTQRCDQALIRF